MKGKLNKKSIILLIVLGLLAIGTLSTWLVWKHVQKPAGNEIVAEDDLESAPTLVLSYNNVALGLDRSFTVEAKTYYKGKEVEDEIQYTWELDEECSEEIASMEADNDSALITARAYGDTAFIVSANYRGTLLVKRLSVHVSNLDVIFDSPNMQMSAGCYTVDLGLIDTETDVTSITPIIYVYDKEELVENPEFTWTNSDETIAIRDESGKITAQKAGTTLIVGKYKESELHIKVNVHRTKIERDVAYIEAIKNYTKSFSEVKGMAVEDVRFSDVSVLKDYREGSGSITFDPDKLPEIGTEGVLVIQTSKMELTMDAMVVTMALYNEENLNNMASVIQSNAGDGYYVLANDIKCAGTYDSNMETVFIGTFDGRGHAIYNMTTSERNAANRGFLGSKMSGLLTNVAFENAVHQGPGGFLVTTVSGAGKMSNVYIKIDIAKAVASTSVLWTYAGGNVQTESVFVEYTNQLPQDAVGGYAVMSFPYGYAKHQGFYVVGAKQIASKLTDLKGGLKDSFGAYFNYGEYLAAGVDVSKWDEDFWAVSNGIPYPKCLDRKAKVPNVKIPEYVGQGTKVIIEGWTIYDYVNISSTMKKYGITVDNNVLTIPDTVPTHTKLKITVQSVFDPSKKVTLSTEVLRADKITVDKICNVEFMDVKTFDIDLSEYAKVIGNNVLFSVTADGRSFTSASYDKGVLTLDAASLEELGKKTVEVMFKGEDSLIIITVIVDACTLSIETEADLNRMASVIVKNNGEGRYVLANDIVCEGIYDACLEIEFKGAFDGHGYTIYNMDTGSRYAATRGLLGTKISGTLENVSFINAVHSGPGGFIATSATGTARMEDVFIQIEIPSSVSSTSVIARYTNGGFKTKNVFVEYKTPLAEDAAGGNAIGNLCYGNGTHQGFYAVGTSKMSMVTTDLKMGVADVYGAYKDYDSMLRAGVDFTGWKNDFWAVNNGLPYPKKLGVRQGVVPQVNLPQYVGRGTSITIGGMTIYDRIVLDTAASGNGVKISEHQLTIPSNIPFGTTFNVSVESVFDATKAVKQSIQVLHSKTVTLNDTFDAQIHGQSTFEVAFGTQAEAVESRTLVSATVNGKPFTTATYENGLLTLDTTTFEELGLQTVEAMFKGTEDLVIVSIPVDACTMSIDSEVELNEMASVIEANGGAGRYVLAEDIVCAGTYNADISTAFTGTFDGRGHAIYNMKTADVVSAKRGLFGQYFSGVLKNVSFVNASHSGAGGFIATNASQISLIENIYMTIEVTPSSASTAVLVTYTNGNFETKNVFIEYKSPLPADSASGYAVETLNCGYGKHQGLYAVGVPSVCKAVSGETDAEVFGAYMTYGDLVSAGCDFSAWANEFWAVSNGLPYPKLLEAREAVIPVVSMPEYVGPGIDISLEGATMYDCAVLSAELKNLGITVNNNVLSIPSTVPLGTEISVQVQSVFDASKSVTLHAAVLETKNVTIEGISDAETYGKTTFELKFGEKAQDVEGCSLITASAEGKTFASASYEAGVLTLDTATLTGIGQQNLTVLFKNNSTLVTVSATIDVCTMVIDNEAELNQMASVIEANGGVGRYLLGTDITCEGTYNANITTAFTGTFDGRGYAIYNMKTESVVSANRGLFGNTLNGTLKNVSFVNASHAGAGGFIATNASAQAALENVYITINMNPSSTSTAVIATYPNGNFTTKNVFIEYITPLAANATSGYALQTLHSGNGKHQGIYVIGAASVGKTVSGSGGTDKYGAYMTYGDFIAAENSLTSWDETFWTITNGLPYPLGLEARKGVKPEVSIPGSIAPGTTLAITGATMYDRVILSSELVQKGITVSNNTLTIPETVEPGTEITIVVQSVFDETKATTIQTKVMGSRNITLSDTVLVAVHGKNTFQIDLGTQKEQVGTATILSATVDGVAFTDSSYENGIITLDTATLGAEYREKTVVVTFKGSTHLITVTVPIDVCTMLIQSEADLNQMPSVIEANGGAGRYLLGADITCEGTYNANITTAFTGTFDGLGHVIRNMKTASINSALRGLFGQNFDGVLKNVSFVNAEHYGAGGFITTNAKANAVMENVYIQIKITSPSESSAVLATYPNGRFETRKVLIEYSTSLASNATEGFAVQNLPCGYGKHQGLYVIGAPSVGKTTSGDTTKDVFGAYADYNAFVAANLDLSAWNNDFWVVQNGRPYPKSLVK